jgi:hypothetical protein
VRHDESVRNAGAPQGGAQTAAPCGGKQTVSHWTSETWWKCEKRRELPRAPPPPPSNGYGPYWILTVCRINLWPAVRMELGQEGWLNQPVAKIRGPIMAGDQGSHRGHHYSETALTGNPSSRVWVAPPERDLLPLVTGSKRLTHWTSETVYWSEITGLPQSRNS